MPRPVKKKLTKTAPIQYGKSFRYTSTEAAIKDLSHIEKKQREEKAKRVCEYCESGLNPPYLNKTTGRWWHAGGVLCQTPEKNAEG